MRITIHQPEYLPWLGFFHKLARADVYVALDNVQYRHKYFQNRNRLRGPAGALWINIPVLRKGKRAQLIKEVEINNTETRWRQKNWKSIHLNYKKSPYFAEYSDYFESIYSKEWRLLADMNLEIIQNCLRFLGLHTKVIRASGLDIAGSGPQLILDICKKLNAETYISGICGIAGRGREFEGELRSQKIKVIYDEFYLLAAEFA